MNKPSDMAMEIARKLCPDIGGPNQGDYRAETVRRARMVDEIIDSYIYPSGRAPDYQQPRDFGGAEN